MHVIQLHTSRVFVPLLVDALKKNKRCPNTEGLNAILTMNSATAMMTSHNTEGPNADLTMNSATALMTSHNTEGLNADLHWIAFRVYERGGDRVELYW
jgi:hypothetical protein